MDKIIVGADTETFEGEPMTIQFYSEDAPIEKCFFVNARNVTETFLKWCKGLNQKYQYVLYMHNLKFDLTELFWRYRARLIENEGEFSFSVDGFKISGVYGSPCFCTVRKGSNFRLLILDSYSFYPGSLRNAAELYCPDLPKMREPVGLGQKRFTRKDGEFVDYAMRDAQITYAIGRSVELLVNEFDISQPYTTADLSSKVFRHKFLTYTIPQPPIAIVYASMKSYHGGVNRWNHKPGWYENVTSIDISSAYPHAMESLPAFSDANLYKSYRGKKSVTSVPPYGVYNVTGFAKDCHYPAIFDHGFKPIQGDFENIWIQGLELNEALRSREVTIKRIGGCYYDHERDHGAPALRNFCQHFYTLKETEKDPIKRHFYKLILNTLYGKFIQTLKRGGDSYVDIETERVVTEPHLEARGMFHPFIASAITAHTRARIHRLEHQHKAIHTATDGILTQQVTKGYKTKATQLGDIVIEAKGDLLMVRNKLYILYGSRPTKKSFPSPIHKGKHILKAGRHGFQGTTRELESLCHTRQGKSGMYIVDRPSQLRESLQFKKGAKARYYKDIEGNTQKMIPNKWRKRRLFISVPVLPVYQPKVVAKRKRAKG